MLLEPGAPLAPSSAIAGAGSCGRMGPIGIRRRLQPHRSRLAAIAVVMACSMAVAAHHSGMAMSDGHGDLSMGARVEMCLAAFNAMGVSVGAVLLAVVPLRPWRPPTRLAPTAAWIGARPTLGRARAGPPLLSLLCVIRR